MLLLITAPGVLTNQRPVFRSRDQYWPIRGQYSLADNNPGKEVTPAPWHVDSRMGPLRKHLVWKVLKSVDQSEASITRVNQSEASIQHLIRSQPSLGEVDVDGGSLLLHGHVGVQQGLLVGRVHGELARQPDKLKLNYYSECLKKRQDILGPELRRSNVVCLESYEKWKRKSWESLRN